MWILFYPHDLFECAILSVINMPVNTSSSASRRVLVIIALVLFVAALILIFVSSLLPNSGRRLSLGGSYADGYRAARDLAFQSGFPQREVRSLVGVVESVSGNSIKIKTKLFVDERVDGVGQERTIVVDSSTKISKQVMKSQDQIRKEQKEFSAKVRELDPEKPAMGTVMPPMPYESANVNVSDIKQGDSITVFPQTDEDLTLKDNVKAKTIEIFPNQPIVAPITNSGAEATGTGSTATE